MSLLSYARESCSFHDFHQRGNYNNLGVGTFWELAYTRSEVFFKSPVTYSFWLMLCMSAQYVNIEIYLDCCCVQLQWASVFHLAVFQVVVPCSRWDHVTWNLAWVSLNHRITKHCLVFFTWSSVLPFSDWKYNILPSQFCYLDNVIANISYMYPMRPSQSPSC